MDALGAALKEHKRWKSSVVFDEAGKVLAHNADGATMGEEEIKCGSRRPPPLLPNDRKRPEPPIERSS